MHPAEDHIHLAKRRVAKAFTAFLVSGGVLLMAFFFSGSRQVAYSDPDLEKTSAAPASAEIVMATHDAPRSVVHVEQPQEVRGIYWTAVTAGTPRGRELLAYMKQTGLNAVVIDLKMDNGQLAFVPRNGALEPYMMQKPWMNDLDGLLQDLESEGVYRIARISIMRDGAFARVHPEAALRWSSGSFWTDKIGSLWLDPASEAVQDYAVALGKEAYVRGFDEIQYDYVRFPSDGSISAIRYPAWDGVSKVAAMQEFFKHVGGSLQEEGIPVSFDVFGMTHENTSDFNIGQRLQDVLPYATVVSGMLYPSHYADGFNGYANPALFPYEIVMHSLESAKKIAEEELEMPTEASAPKLRPWLQDFDIGAVYTSARIEAQIKAARDAGASGWMLWNARNVYEPANYLPPHVESVSQDPE